MPYAVYEAGGTMFHLELRMRSPVMNVQIFFHFGIVSRKHFVIKLNTRSVLYLSPMDDKECPSRVFALQKSHVQLSFHGEKLTIKVISV